MELALAENQYDKIAGMLVMGVPHSQVAAATGLSEVEISEVSESPDFQQVLAEKASAQHTKYATLNDGWDMMENLSMNTVLTHLQMSPDPDFALKAAVMANKAQRRGQYNPGNVIPGQAGVRAVINLSANFINQLQNNFKITQTKPSELVKKDSNFLAPKAVSSLLVPVSDLPEEFAELKEIREVQKED